MPTAARKTSNSKTTAAATEATPPVENTATAAAPSDSFSFASVEITEEKELPTGTRDTEPNPLEDAVKAAAGGAARGLPVPDGKRAKDASRLIRRAVSANGLSLRLRFTDMNGAALTPAAAEASTEPVKVFFKITTEKTERAYTERKYKNADIREWANLAEGEKISKEIRQEYRKQHGFDVRKR